MAASKSYLGLRGHKLHVATVVLVVLPSFILFGYAGGAMGGIAGLPSFIKVIIDSSRQFGGWGNIFVASVCAVPKQRLTAIAIPPVRCNQRHALAELAQRKR